MKKSALLLCIIVLSLFPFISYAQIKEDVSEYAGIAWQTWDAYRKNTFIGGFIAGTGLIIEKNLENLETESYDQSRAADMWVDFNYAEGKKKKNFSRNDVFLLTEFEKRNKNEQLSKYYIVGITTGQIVEGLDILYKDFRNKQIKITEAIYVVKKQIKGISQEEIDTILEYLRSSDRKYYKLRYTGKDGKVYFATFP